MCTSNRNYVDVPWDATNNYVVLVGHVECKVSHHLEHRGKIQKTFVAGKWGNTCFNEGNPGCTISACPDCVGMLRSLGGPKILALLFSTVCVIPIREMQVAHAVRRNITCGTFVCAEVCRSMQYVVQR